MPRITRSPAYLIRNPHSYCFRMNVPKDLRPLIRKRELRYSLRTGYLGTAKMKARLLASRVQLLFREIRQNRSMSGLSNLTDLALYNNHLSDIGPLCELSNLRVLQLSGNQISDISPLSELSNLMTLSLEKNQISDVGPLISNLGIGNGDRVTLIINPLNVTSCSTYVPQLEARGVSVYHDCQTYDP